MLQAGVHLLLLNQLALIRLSDALAHGSTKAGILLKQAQRRIFDQPFGVLQITPNGYRRQFRLQ